MRYSGGGGLSPLCSVTARGEREKGAPRALCAACAGTLALRAPRQCYMYIVKLSESERERPRAHHAHYTVRAGVELYSEASHSHRRAREREEAGARSHIHTTHTYTQPHRHDTRSCSEPVALSLRAPSHSCCRRAEESDSAGPRPPIRFVSSRKGG